MQPSLREDYLEAIQQFSEKNAHPPRYAELAVILGKPESVVRSDMERPCFQRGCLHFTRGR